MPTIEVCFTPLLFDVKITTENFVVIVTDILRATSAICSAFYNGAKGVIPVSSSDEAFSYKNNNNDYLIAGERDGVILQGADLGNSPLNFTREKVKDKVIVFTTTNGTQAIQKAKTTTDLVIIGAFVNISCVYEWLMNNDKNVVLLCAGWKNKFNLEDSIFAGALCEKLISSKKFYTNCDSAIASMYLWNKAKENINEFLKNCSHTTRLKNLGISDSISWCFEKDITPVLPIMKENMLVDLYK